MRLSRRGMLRGLSFGAGYSLLAPFLNRLEAQAAPAGSTPRRFVFVLQSNGLLPWEVQPVGLTTGTHRVLDLPLTGRELPAGMAPLQEFQDRTTILQKLGGRHTRPCHSAGFGALSGTLQARSASAPTIDAVLAREFPAAFPLVNLGISNLPALPADGLIACCSAWGANRPIATQCRPDLAWKALFGSVAEAAGVLGRGLDTVKDDLGQVRAVLSAEERAALDRYLQSFDAADKSQRLARDLPPDRSAPAAGEQLASPVKSVQLEAQFDLAAAALIGGLTNVVTICSGACSPNGKFDGLGADCNIHPIGHFQDSGQRTWRDLYTMLRRYHLDLVARLARKLDETPEGDGSMLDNTVIVYTSDAAHTHHSNGSEWPFVLLGSLGGRLKTGRYLAYPVHREEGSRTINALYCTLLHAAGVPRESFNVEGATAGVDRKGPLEDLLTG